jgi:nicotinate-nucleotide adenylyltransferase
MSRYTFLLPAYKAKYLPEALESIKRQSFQDFEVIVSDDCSPEDIKGAFDRCVGDDPRFFVSDVEMHLSTPSYTINTLTALSEQYPDCEFVFICGMDSLQNLKNWREYQKILDNYELLVFPREGYDGGELANYPSVNILKTPVLEISSTFIRHSIKEGRDVRHFVPEKVFQYIQEHHFYE